MTPAGTKGDTMAKLTGPLMSLDARGTIAKTITYSGWKGIKVARQRVVPANPNTAAQAAQRALMTTVVEFWRNTNLAAEAKTAWGRLATAGGLAQSGFNAFASAALKIAAQDADASMVSSFDSPSASGVSFGVSNIDDFATGDESGTFTAQYGNLVGNMVYTATSTISTGFLSFDVSANFSASDVIYMRIVKDAGSVVSADRSGVWKITLS